MSDRPLADVLRTAIGGYEPEHPERDPWSQPLDASINIAYTGDVVTIPLKHADRAQLHGLDRPTDNRDSWVEPGDWTRAAWGLPPC